MSRRMLMIAGAALIALGAAAAFWLMQPRPDVPDEALLRALANVPQVTAYTQYVATETEVAGRRLVVEGTYHIDRTRARYASSATTTLFVPDEEPQRFNLANISISSDVYVKIEPDEALRERIPHSPEWRHFRRDQIPPSFTDIAIAGPILDNLLLLSDNGAYVRLLENRGEETWGDEQLRRYTFERADFAGNPGGTLETLLGRVGGGTVDVWIEPHSGAVRHLAIESDGYHSTTTFSNVNNIPQIEPPADIAR